MIQIFSNSLGEEELAAIKKVVDSKWLGKGKECDNFEKEMSDYFGVPEALLINNCTAGIYLALKALGVGPGDEVIIPTINFVAIPSTVIGLGAKPIFADVDPNYFNILPSEIERLKTPKTKAVFLLHYGGHAAPFDEIKAVCGNKILILEDSANSVASTYKGVHCGALGDAGVFSFDAMKTLVMGDGGALIVKDPEARERVKSERYLGFSSTTTSGYASQHSGNKRWWEYDLDCAAGRFISNDILASMGRIQLKKLPGFIEKRKAVWNRYQDGLKNLSEIVLPPEPLEGTTGSYYLYWIKVNSGKRDKLANHLRENGIYTTFRYFPLHMVKYYGAKERFKNAEEINESALNIPLHQNLSDDDVSKIIDSIKTFSK